MDLVRMSNVSPSLSFSGFFKSSAFLWGCLTIGICLLVFGLLVQSVFVAHSFVWDQVAIDGLRLHPLPSIVMKLLKALTSLADKAIVIPVAAVLTMLAFLFRRYRLAAGFLIADGLSGRFSELLLKAHYTRIRPLGASETFMRSLHELSYSFPSGHATFSVCFYGLLSYFLIKHFFPAAKNWILGAQLLLVFLIGLSRVALNVHYVSDVLAGYAIGGIILTLSIWGYEYASATFLKQPSAQT
jgi:membrane-associated phospholipid phosphatase